MQQRSECATACERWPNVRASRVGGLPPGATRWTGGAAWRERAALTLHNTVNAYICGCGAEWLIQIYAAHVCCVCESSLTSALSIKSSFTQLFNSRPPCKPDLQVQASFLSTFYRKTGASATICSFAAFMKHAFLEWTAKAISSFIYCCYYFLCKFNFDHFTLPLCIHNIFVSN